MTEMPIEICPRQADLVDSPIDPDWLIEGAPRARAMWWSTGTDGVDSNHVWDCTAGRFRWYFACDETVHVIEGEVEVSADGVKPAWLRAGDAALFRAGTWSTWNVPRYVRKHAILRRELPGPLSMQIRCARWANGLLRRLRARRAPVDAPVSVPTF